jgi:AcrR family transcriptional regulator
VLEEHDGPAEQLRDVFRAFARSVQMYQANVTVFFEERRHLTGERIAAVRRKQDEFDGVFRDVILRGIERGVFRRDIDAHVVYLAIVGVFSWMHHWCRAEGPLSAEQIGDTFAELVLDGIRAA